MRKKHKVNYRLNDTGKTHKKIDSEVVKKALGAEEVKKPSGPRVYVPFGAGVNLSNVRMDPPDTKYGGSDNGWGKKLGRKPWEEKE